MINRIKKYFNDLKHSKSAKVSSDKNITDKFNIEKGNISLSQILLNKSADEVEDLMTNAYYIKNDDEVIEKIHKLIAEPWHRSYEEMAHYLQNSKRPKSVPFIKNAMLKRYDHLESYGTGTRQFINQCGHALKSIGTDKAISVIRELTKSDDAIIKDEMLYRISKIEKRNDYERNYDIE